MSGETPATHIRQRSFRLLPLALTACIGTAGSLAVFTLARSWERQRSRTAFEFAAHERNFAVERAIRSSLKRFKVVAEFLRSSPDVDEGQFRAFAKPLLSRWTAIENLHCVRPVADGERASYEAARRAEGLSDFTIQERNDAGDVVRAARRPEYFVVYRAETSYGDGPAVGFDSGSHAACRNRFIRARDTASVIGCNADIRPDDPASSRYRVFVPIYDTDSPPDSVDARRKHIKEFAVGTLRIHQVVEDALASFAPDRIDVRIVDTSAPADQRVLDRSSSPSLEPMRSAQTTASAGWQYASTLDLPWTAWSIVGTPTPAFLAAGRTFQPWTLLLGGLLFTSLVAGLLQSNVARAARLTDERRHLVEEIAERRSAEEELRLFSRIVENMAEGVNIVRADDLVIVYTNPRMDELFGYEAGELIGKHVSVVNAPDERAPQQTADAIARTLAEHGTWRGEMHSIRKDGTRFWCQATIAIVEHHQHGQVYVSMREDVTERKQAEAALRESEERFRSLSAMAPIGIFLADSDGRCIYTNARVREICGLTEERALGYGWRRVIHPDDRNAVLEEIERSRTEDREFTFEYRILTPDGKLRWVDSRALSMYSDAGEPIGKVGTIVDITERRRAESELRESERRYRAIVEDQTELICRGTPDHIITFVNEAYCRYFGKSREELMGHSFLPLIPAEDQAKVADHFASFCPAQPVATHEYRVIMGDGTIRWQQWTNRALFDGDDKIVEFQSVGRDVTDRRLAQEALQRANNELERRVAERTAELTETNRRLRAEIAERQSAEESLRRSEHQLRMITDNVPALISYIDTDHRYRFANQRYREWAGVPPDQIVGKHVAEFLGPENYERLRPYIERALSGDAGGYETPVDRGGGDIRYIKCRYVPDIDEQGRIKGFYALSVDITERRQAEAALRESEDKFRDFFEGASDVVLLVGRDWRILEINRRGEELTGYTRGELIGQDLLDVLVAPEDHDAIRRVVEKLLAGERQLYSVHWLTKEGHRIAFEGSSTARRSSEGRLVSTRCILRDVTERRHAEAALRESEARLRAVLASTHDPMVTIDAHGTVQSASDSVERVFGWAPAELVGQAVNVLIPEPERTQHNRHLAEYRRAGRSDFLGRPREMTAVRKDGSTFACEVTIWRVDLPGRDETIFTGLIRDITERKRAEKQLRHAERLASLGTLAAGIAHEINNPLGTILLAAGYARRAGATADDATQALDAIAGDAKRCGRIVKSLLQFARNDTTEKWLGDFNAVVRSAGELTRKYAEHRGASLHFELADSLPRVRMNPTAMEQVLVNLIQNAVQAGETDNHVTLRTEAAQRTVRVSVQDAGCGMTEEQMRHLFDPFFTTRAETGGTGLGLSITHGIVADHGGSVRVQSQPGRGTKLIVELPIESNTFREDPDHVECTARG